MGCITSSKKETLRIEQPSPEFEKTRALKSSPDDETTLIQSQQPPIKWSPELQPKLAYKTDSEISAAQDIINENCVKLKYEEAVTLQPSNPTELWEIVKRTCEQKSDATIESVKNRRGWRTIRVFVSSTFRDFHSEREVLVKEVFPDLRLWCEQRKLHLVECDLRWGVPKDSTSEETIRICLGELDRCCEDNTVPYFLNLTCERAGWVPSSGDVSHNLAVQYGLVLGLSVTEMEIVHGAFRKYNPNALFLIRDSNFMETIPKELKDAFVDSDPLALQKVKKLKEMLHQQFPAENIVNYQVTTDATTVKRSQETKDERTIRLQGLSGANSHFYKTVYNFFKERIEKQYPLDPTPEDPLEAQRTAQESFMDTRSQVVLGRDKLLLEIEDYILNDTSQAPLLLVGTAGSGKSAIMARVAAAAKNKAERGEIPGPGNFANWQVFYHFVGATPGSTDLAFFLQRLTRELNTQKDTVSDLDSLIQLSNSLMSNPNTKPSIVILDAVNQLDDDKIQYLIRWLPEKLSSNVRVVISMIDETECHRLLRSYKTGPKEIVCGELDYSSRQEIVANILRQYNKRLDDHQMSLLLDKKGSANPLWLSLACEELRVCGDFNKIDENVINLSDELLGLEAQVLTRFEEENGGEIVRATLCLLETSRHGLLETELLQLLADETLITPTKYNENNENNENNKDISAADESNVKAKTIGDLGATDDLAKKLHKQVDETYVQKDDNDEKEKKASEHVKRREIKFIPAAKWAIVYRALKPLLRPCGDLGEGRLDFYHRSISKAVRQKYFSGSEGYVKHQYIFWHGLHATFFEKTEDFDRKSEELPYHLEQLLDNSRLTRCLLEWPVFERLYSEDFSIDLLRSWQMAGGYGAASQLYKESLNVLRDSGAPLKDVADKIEKVVIFLIQAGQYNDACELLENLRDIEEQSLGARTDNMADIYQLMGKTKSEVVKNINFVTSDQLEDDKEVVEYCYKSLSFRKQLRGEEHEFKTGMTNIVIAHHLGIVAELEKTTAVKTRRKAFKAIDEAIAIFQKQGDMGHMAEAIMTKSFINSRAERYFKEKEEMLLRAYELCRKTYGEKHMLMLRLYLNTGILYEDSRNYEKAYDFFVKWHEVSMEVLGPSHPKAVRAKDTLEEAMYVRIRQQRERQAAGTA